MYLNCSKPMLPFARDSISPCQSTVDYGNTKIRSKSVRAFKMLKLDTIQYTDSRKKKNEKVVDADPDCPSEMTWHLSGMKYE